MKKFVAISVFAFGALIVGLLGFGPQGHFSDLPVVGAETSERNKTFTYADLTGTIPTSTTYVTMDATTNPCGFSFDGYVSRTGSTGAYALLINIGKTPASSITITVPSYVTNFTGIKMGAYATSTTARYFKINGITDTTAITSAYTYASPVYTGIIAVSGTTILIEPTVGAISIANFTLYYQ